MNKRILVADDEPGIRTLVSGILEMTHPSYAVELIHSGEGLYQRLKSIKDEELVSLSGILLDNNMPPGMKGLEVLEKYAKDTRFEKIPFIMMSSDGVEQQALDLGARYYFGKPLNFGNFMRKIKEVIV